MRITGGICLILLGLLLFGYGISLAISPRIYESTVRIKVEKEPDDLLNRRDRPGFDPYWVQTEFEKIQSKVILYPVISNLQLQIKWATKKKTSAPLSIDQAYVLLKNGLEVCQLRDKEGGPSPVAITVRSEGSTEGAFIANAIADEYYRNRFAMAREMRQRGLATYTNQLQKAEQQVMELEVRLSQSKHDTILSNKLHRDLNTLKALAEQMRTRLKQELVDAKELKSPVEILDRAEPATKPVFPNQIKAGAIILIGLLSLFCGILLLKSATIESP